MSGAIDFVVAREGIAQIQNGDAMMTKVTGMGCSATAILGAFAAVGESPFISAQAALATVALAGERAAKQSHGPGSLALNYLDQLYGIRMADFERGLKLEQQ